MKKLLITLAFALAGPVCALLLPGSLNRTFAVSGGLYAALALYCLGSLLRHPPRKEDALMGVAIGLLTLPITIPLQPVGILAAAAAALAFPVCRQRLHSPFPHINWYLPGVGINIKVLGGITLGYLALCMMNGRLPGSFSLLRVFKALAPALSEELIFRMLLPMLLWKRFDLRDGFSGKAWVFCTITPLFACLHCVEAFAGGQADVILATLISVGVNTLLHAWLIDRFGFAYGVYAHWLTDFLAFSQL